jgi:hypothetical protein
VRRLPCYRCGKPAETQWQVCADGNLYRPLCILCDIALNRLVLRWMGDPEADKKVRRYDIEKIGDRWQGMVMNGGRVR